MTPPVKFDVSDDGRLLVYGLEALPPETAAAMRADIRELKAGLVEEIIAMKTKLADGIRAYGNPALTEKERQAIEIEGNSIISILPESTVKRIFEEN